MVLHAGKFEQNLAVLALEYLDVGRNYAELVDTVAEYVVGGVLYRSLHGVLEGCTGSVIAGTLFEIADIKNHTEVGSRTVCGGEGTILFDECAYVVVALMVGLAYDGIGLGESLFESGVNILGGLERTEHVGHVDLQNYVHTAFKVKTEVNSPFLNLRKGVTEIHFFLAVRVHVVFVGLVIDRVGVANFFLLS